MPNTDFPKIAAIVPQPGQRADAMLREFITRLQTQGFRVKGLIQEACPDSWGCKFSLIDLETGKRYPISQNLGSQSTACSLDVAGIADATVVMRRVATNGADLAVFNRFSGLEADGEGFAAEMLEVMSRESRSSPSSRPPTCPPGDSSRGAWLANETQIPTNWRAGLLRCYSKKLTDLDQHNTSRHKETPNETPVSFFDRPTCHHCPARC